MKEQAIKFFDLYTKDYDMILTGDLRKQNMFFCKFIRNTNKLDILYSMGMIYLEKLKTVFLIEKLLIIKI